jgi:DNA-binding GntR family transcriptional regulator
MKSDADKIYTTLKQRLIRGDYPPGTHLREEPIAQECGLSRTPVRAALKRLVEEGLATSGSKQGIRVAAWNKSDIEEIFQLRIVLEPVAAKLTAQRRDEDVIAQLRANNENIGRLIAEPGPVPLTEIERLVQQFHCILIDNCESPRLRMMLRTIIEVPNSLQLSQTDEQEELKRIVDRHRDVIDCIEIRDAELAFQVMQLHLKFAYNRYIYVRDKIKQV